MSDAVIVGIISGSASVAAAALAAYATYRHHRHHEAVSLETERVVRDIYVVTNGKLEAARQRIAELEEQIEARR